jgi:hypothetical protein
MMLLYSCTFKLFLAHKQNRSLPLRNSHTIAVYTIFALLVKYFEDLTSGLQVKQSPPEIFSSSCVPTAHRRTSSFTSAREAAGMC